MNGAPRVHVSGPAHLAAAVAAQGVTVERVPAPPADIGDVLLGTLTVAYADDRVDDANRAVAEHLGAARPVLEAVAPAGSVVTTGAARWVMVAGTGPRWEDLADAQRSAACAACVLEGWADHIAAARGLLETGAVTLLPTAGGPVAAPGAAAVSPGTPCFVARDAASGRRGAAPVLAAGEHALWRGAASGEALRREREVRERVAPALAAALRARGPLDPAPLVARARGMGDDGHGRTEALTLLVVTALLPEVARRDPEAAAALAGLACADGALGLAAMMAAGRAVEAGMPDDGPSTILRGVTAGRAGEVAVTLAGTPGRWFRAQAPAPVDGAGRGAEHLGDSAVVELLGLGAATGAPVTGMGPHAAPEDAAHAAGRAAARERVSVPVPGGPSGAAVDARRCCEVGEGPVFAAPALGRRGTVTVRPLVVPVAALAAAVTAVVRDLEAG